MVRKEHLAIGIYIIVKSIVKLSVFRHVFSENSHFFDEKLNFGTVNAQVACHIMMTSSIMTSCNKGQKMC